jgi:hypothetical protein
VSWRDLALTLGPVVVLSAAAIWAAFWFVRPAPPDTIVLSAGPEGSTFQMHAERYRKILAKNGVKLEILPSHGSVENLKRLADAAFTVDVGFVQGGVAEGVNLEGLVSLGSMFHQPVAVFYSGQRITRLSQLQGRRLAIGAEGSGARVLALGLLKANGIEPGGRTALLDLAGNAAVEALMQRKVDAAFLMGDSAAGQVMRKLMETPGIRLFDFPQADGYTRRFRHLNKLEVPMGAIDLGRNIPAHNLQLIGPTVELIAREDLHPALSDLLIEAATEVHGKAGTLAARGRVSCAGRARIPDQQRRHPLLQVGQRVSLPLSAVLGREPGRSHGGAARARPRDPAAGNAARTRPLPLARGIAHLPLVRRAPLPGTRGPRESGARGAQELLKRLADIERGVARIKVPLSFAGELYVLREHVNFVRGQLSASDTGAPKPRARPRFPSCRDGPKVDHVGVTTSLTSVHISSVF